MGGDGGSIARRGDVVRVKEREGQVVDPALLNKPRWTTCAVSAEPLSQPVVACALGFLYNRESVLEYIMAVLSGELKSLPQFEHLRGLRDLFPCNLHYSGDRRNPASAQAVPVEQEESGRFFSCPVTGTDANGKYPFVRVSGCGCVVSLKAVENVGGVEAKDQELKNEEQPDASPPLCIACGEPVDTLEGGLSPADLPAELSENAKSTLLRSIPPKVLYTQLNAPVEVVEALRTANDKRQAALAEARARIKKVKKQAKHKRKLDQSAASNQPASADGDQAQKEKSERAEGRKNKKQKEAKPAPAAVPLPASARLAREAEEQVRANMSENVKTLFMSKEKQMEAPLFTSTRMMSPMSRL